MVQRGPLATDLPATRRALEQHLADWPRLVAREAEFLRQSGAQLVFGDVPPLAFAAAAEAGVPSVAMANFSWSWIYDGFAAVEPFFADAAAFLRQAESQATLLLHLDMGGGLDAFPRHQRIAPVARPLSRPRDAIRATLGLEKARTFVLFSLGGFGDDLEVQLQRDRRHQVLVTSVKMQNPPPGVRVIDVTDALPHHELAAAADCLIGKPGYGTVSECLRRPTPFCWLPRGDFREGPPLTEAIRRWLPSAPLELEDLRTGRWGDIRRRRHRRFAARDATCARRCGRGRRRDATDALRRLDFPRAPVSPRFDAATHRALAARSGVRGRRSGALRCFGGMAPGARHP